MAHVNTPLSLCELSLYANQGRLVKCNSAHSSRQKSECSLPPNVVEMKSNCKQYMSTILTELGNVDRGGGVQIVRFAETTLFVLLGLAG